MGSILPLPPPSRPVCYGALEKSMCPVLESVSMKAEAVLLECVPRYVELRMVSFHNATCIPKELEALIARCQPFWTRNQFIEAELVYKNLELGNQVVFLPWSLRNLLKGNIVASTDLLNTVDDFLIHKMDYISLYVTLCFDHDQQNKAWYRVNKIWKSQTNKSKIK